GGLFKRRERSDVMLCGSRAKRDYRSVLPSPSKSFEAAAVGFVCHSDRSVQRRISVPISRIERVENSADEVILQIFIEGRGVCSSVDVVPAVRCGLRQIWVDRESDRREKELLRLAVMIDRNLRIPFHKRRLHIPRFFLRESKRVAVQVKSVMANAAVNA